MEFVSVVVLLSFFFKFYVGEGGLWVLFIFLGFKILMGILIGVFFMIIDIILIIFFLVGIDKFEVVFVGFMIGKNLFFLIKGEIESVYVFDEFIGMEVVG